MRDEERESEKEIWDRPIDSSEDVPRVPDLTHKVQNWREPDEEDAEKEPDGK